MPKGPPIPCVDSSTSPYNFVFNPCYTRLPEVPAMMPQQQALDIVHTKAIWFQTCRAFATPDTNGDDQKTYQPEVVPPDTENLCVHSSLVTPGPVAVKKRHSWKPPSASYSILPSLVVHSYPKFHLKSPAQGQGKLQWAAKHRSNFEEFLHLETTGLLESLICIVGLLY